MLEWADSRHIFAYFVSPGMGKTGVSLSVIDNLITSGRSKGVFLMQDHVAGGIPEVGSQLMAQGGQSQNPRGPTSLGGWIGGCLPHQPRDARELLDPQERQKAYPQDRDDGETFQGEEDPAGGHLPVG